MTEYSIRDVEISSPATAFLLFVSCIILSPVRGTLNISLSIEIDLIFFIFHLLSFSSCHPRMAFASVSFMRVISSHPDMPATLLTVTALVASA
jgi:hypothetical protein